MVQQSDTRVLTGASRSRRARLATVAFLAMLVGAFTAGAAAPAYAASTYPLLAPANVRLAPNTDALIVATFAKGATISIDCYVDGQSVNGTAIWDHVPGQGWISDSLVLTASDGPVVPKCGPAPYDRAAAVRWALGNVNSAYRFGNDCTWFVSNALWAGGLPQTGDWTAKTTDLSRLASKTDILTGGGPSKAAANADYFKNAVVKGRLGTLTEIDVSDVSAGGAQSGDVILYDWNNGADGVVDHAAIVTRIDANHTVGITQHTPNREYRQWNLDGEGHPLKNLRAYLLHITR